MVKRSRNFYLDEEDLELIEELAERYTKELGTRISQAAIVEVAVRKPTKEDG